MIRYKRTQGSLLRSPSVNTQLIYREKHDSIRGENKTSKHAFQYQNFRLTRAYTDLNALAYRKVQGKDRSANYPQNFVDALDLWSRVEGFHISHSGKLIDHIHRSKHYHYRTIWGDE